MAEKPHKFLLVTDDTDILEEYRDWLNLYVQALQKTRHKADFGQVHTKGKTYFYMMLIMNLTNDEMNFIEQMTNS